ncbi:MAG TPA: AraC family transcriptional regulator [Pyrinomonadaceae bacterium]|nr:AraC family transcriptional regulator [Pyrinomonadaceae bacterium]
MTDSRVSRICGLMRKNLARDWKIEELAIEANMSESHFQKLFKSEMKISPCAFLQEERLKKAAELLEGEWEHINIIARKVGIPDLSHFSRNFKKKLGKTPAAYRKNFHDKMQEKYYPPKNDSFG